MAKRTSWSDGAEWFWPRKESTWHKLRGPDITATSAAALFGVSPYQTAFELFQILSGKLEVVFEEGERMKWGKRLERVIAEGICEDNGWQILDASPFLYARSKRWPGMGCSPDFIIADPERPDLGPGVLEIKNVDLFIAKDQWEAEEAPVHIEFQLQDQIECTALKWGVIGGLVGGNSTRVYRREADSEAGEAIGRAIVDMHDRVKRGEAPEPDFRRDLQTLKALHRIADVGKSRDFGVDKDAEEEKRFRDLAEKYHAAKNAAKDAEEDKKAAEAALLHALGDTESVFAEGLKIKAPTITTEGGMVERKPSTYRRFYVSFPKPKGQKNGK